MFRTLISETKNSRQWRTTDREKGPPIGQSSEKKGLEEVILKKTDEPVLML